MARSSHKHRRRRIGADFDVVAVGIAEEDLRDVAVGHDVLAIRNAVLLRAAARPLRDRWCSAPGDRARVWISPSGSPARGILDQMDHDPVVEQPGAGKIEIGPRHFAKPQHVAIEAAAFFQPLGDAAHVIDGGDRQRCGHGSTPGRKTRQNSWRRSRCVCWRRWQYSRSRARAATCRPAGVRASRRDFSPGNAFRMPRFSRLQRFCRPIRPCRGEYRGARAGAARRGFWGGKTDGFAIVFSAVVGGRAHGPVGLLPDALALRQYLLRDAVRLLVLARMVQPQAVLLRSVQLLRATSPLRAIRTSSTARGTRGSAKCTATAAVRTHRERLESCMTGRTQPTPAAPSEGMMDEMGPTPDRRTAGADHLDAVSRSGSHCRAEPDG